MSCPVAERSDSCDLARNETSGSSWRFACVSDSMSVRSGLDFLRRLNHICVRSCRAMTAGKALRLDPPFVDAFHERRHHRIGGYRRAWNIQIGHDTEPGIGHVHYYVGRRVGIIDGICAHLAATIVHTPLAVDFDYLGREGRLWRESVQCFRPR